MNWPPKRDSEAHFSSVSPSSERIEELLVVCGLYTEKWSHAILVGARQREKQHKLVP